MGRSREQNHMNNDFYKKLIEKLPNGYCYGQVICDQNNTPVEFKYIEVNRAFEEITRLKASQIIGQKRSDILQVSNLVEFDWKNFYAQVAIDKVSMEMELFFEHVNRWYRVIAYSPEKYYFITLFNDITKEIKDLQEKTIILTALNDIVFELDKDLIFLNVFVSDGNHLFFPREKIIGSRLSDLFPQALADELHSALKKSVHSGNNEVAIYKSPLPGDDRWFRAEMHYKEINGIKKYIVSIADISEQKKTQEALEKSHQRFDQLAEHSRTVTWEVNAQGQFIYVSPVVEKVVGYTPDDMVGRMYFYDLFTDSDRETLKRGALEYFSRKEPFIDFVYSAQTKSGNIIYVSINGMPILNEDGTLKGYQGSVTDITEKKELEQIIFNEKEQFKTTLLSVGDGVISTDNQGNIRIINQIAQKLTGWTQEEAMGKPLEEVFNIVHEHTRETCNNPAQEVLKTGQIIQLANHTSLISKTGQEIPIEDSAAPIKDENGQITGVVIVFRDFTEKREKQKQVEYLSFHDHLTGLYNRRYMEDALKRLDTERNLPFTIMVLDVNDLKLTNDCFGHEKGDQLLKAVAKIMTKKCRTDEIVCRTGGDEFAILLPNIHKEQAEAIKQRITQAALEEDLDSVVVSLAIGYAVKETQDQDIMQIHKEADNNMYKDKSKLAKTR